VVPQDAGGDALKRRGFVTASGAVVVAAGALIACSLRDTSYLQAGDGGSPTDTGPGGETTPGDGASNAIRTAATVIGDLVGPSRLDQDADNLYWLSGDGKILAIRKDGSEAAPRTLATPAAAVNAIAVGPTAVFYASGNAIFTLPKTSTGGQGTSIGTTEPLSRALAVDDAFVFAMAENNNSGFEFSGLYRFQHDGGAPTVLRRAEEAQLMVAIALHGPNVFWDEGEGTFYALPKTAMGDGGATPQTFTTPGAQEIAYSELSFAVDDNAFFFSDGTNVRTHARLTSSSATTLLAYADTDDTVTAIALDETSVYAVETAVDGTLRRRAKDGKTDPELLLDKLDKPNSLAVDATSVYVAVEGPPGKIVKCAK
jgi:hypothetical protein